MKTKLDLLLDRVKYAEHELTLDCIKLTPNAAEVVQREAERRGFTASYDGVHADSRFAGTSPTWDEMSGFLLRPGSSTILGALNRRVAVPLRLRNGYFNGQRRYYK